MPIKGAILVVMLTVIIAVAFFREPILDWIREYKDEGGDGS